MPAARTKFEPLTHLTSHWRAFLRRGLEASQQTYDLPPSPPAAGPSVPEKNGWLVQVYGENLADVRAQLNASYYLWYKAVTVNRPRTLGLRMSYSFGD
jgi:hypothetical protein